MTKAKNDKIRAGVRTIPIRETSSLLGDPAMTLDYPQYNVVSTKVDNVPRHTAPRYPQGTEICDHIRRSKRDWTGAKMTSFNGTCFPLVYDKMGDYQNACKMKPGYALE